VSGTSGRNFFSFDVTRSKNGEFCTCRDRKETQCNGSNGIEMTGSAEDRRVPELPRVAAICSWVLPAAIFNLSYRAYFLAG
jgi:hypothetical protein